MLYDAISYIYRKKIAVENYHSLLRITNAKRHKSCYMWVYSVILLYVQQRTEVSCVTIPSSDLEKFFIFCTGSNADWMGLSWTAHNEFYQKYHKSILSIR